MTDKRLLYLLVAVFVIAAASTDDIVHDGVTKTGESEAAVDKNVADVHETVAADRAETADDKSELKKLLGAVKHYLDAQIARDSNAAADAAADTDKKSKKATIKDLESRVNAHEDARTIYDPSTTAAEVGRAESSGRGYWTKWINVDRQSAFGDGQYENCERIQYEQDEVRQCYLGCQTPLAVRYALADPKTKATWSDIESCVGRMGPERVTSCGFRCDDQQARFSDKTNCDMAQCGAYGLGHGCVRCPNVRVQFFCMGTEPSKDTCCPYSTACTKGESRSLRDRLAKLDSDAAKRDVIAGILHEVKKVLEPADDEEQ